MEYYILIKKTLKFCSDSYQNSKRKKETNEKKFQVELRFDICDIINTKETNDSKHRSLSIIIRSEPKYWMLKRKRFDVVIRQMKWGNFNRVNGEGYTFNTFILLKGTTYSVSVKYESFRKFSLYSLIHIEPISLIFLPLATIDYSWGPTTIFILP